jgi:hypothetical protein
MAETEKQCRAQAKGDVSGDWSHGSDSEGNNLTTLSGEAIPQK